MRTWKKIALTAAAAAALALFLLWRAGGVIMTAEYKEYPCGVQSVTCTMRNLSLSTAYYGAPFSVSVLRCGCWGPAYNSDAHVKFELWKKALPPLSSKNNNLSGIHIQGTGYARQISYTNRNRAQRSARSSLVPVCNSGIAIQPTRKERPHETPICHLSHTCRADALRLCARRASAACGNGHACTNSRAYGCSHSRTDGNG